MYGPPSKKPLSTKKASTPQHPNGHGDRLNCSKKIYVRHDMCGNDKEDRDGAQSIAKRIVFGVPRTLDRRHIGK